METYLREVYEPMLRLKRLNHGHALHEEKPRTPRHPTETSPSGDGVQILALGVPACDRDVASACEVLTGWIGSYTANNGTAPSSDSKLSISGSSSSSSSTKPPKMAAGVDGLIPSKHVQPLSGIFRDEPTKGTNYQMITCR